MRAKIYKFIADFLTRLPYSRLVSLWVDWLIERREKLI